MIGRFGVKTCQMPTLLGNWTANWRQSDEAV
jgi:hypothetical protein